MIDSSLAWLTNPATYKDPFIYLAIMVIISSILVVTMKNLFRAAIALAADLAVFAFIYLSLQAGFVAVIQVLLYTSTVAALMLFIIMLIKKDEKQQMVRPVQNVWKKYTPVLLGLFVAVFGVLMIGIFVFTPGLAVEPTPIEGDVIPVIGESFLTTFVLPFELISLLLFVAVIGAIIIARRKDPVAEVTSGFDDEVSK